MATTNTPATMQAYQKEVYGRVKEIIPKQSHFVNATKFAPREARLGRTYNESVFLGFENGFTFAKSAAMQTLNDAVAQSVEEASLQGSEVALRTAIARKSLGTAMRKGKASYGNFMEQTLKMMKFSYANMLEVLSVNGNRNIGVIDTGGFTAGSGTATIQITAGSFIPLAWLGRVGIKIDVYNAAGDTKRNSGDLTVTGVPSSLTAPVITVSGSAGDTDAGSMSDGDYIWYKGAKDEVATGVAEIAGLTTSDSYAGISCSSYPSLWTGNTESSVGGITRAKLEAGFTNAAMKGAEGDHVVLITPNRWQDIADDHRSDRSVDSSYDPKKGKFGSKQYELSTLTGKAVLLPSLAVRQEEAVAFPVGGIMRIGSADMEFNSAARGEDEGWAIRTHGTLDVEFHLYGDQAPYTTEVKSHILFSGLT